MVDWDALVLAPLQAVFGEPVTFIPASGAAPVVGSGIFDEAYTEVDAVGGIISVGPALGIRLSEFQSPFQTAPKQDDRFVVRGKTYTVREPRPDSHGGMKLLLNIARP